MTAPVKADPAQTHLAKELKHTSPLLSCRIEPSGRFIFAGAQDSSIQRWDLATGTKTALAGHKSWVRGLVCLDKGKLLISGDYHGKVLWWPADADKPTPSRTVQAHRGWARAVAVSPDGKTLATCGNDKLVKLWSVADGKLLRQLAGHACHFYNVAFHPGGKFLVSADLKGVVKQWDLAKFSVARELDAKVLYKYDKVFMADHGGVRGMAFNADGTLLACSGITDVTNAFAGIGKPLVVLFDWKTGKAKQLLRPKEQFVGTAWGVAFHPAGPVVGVGGGNGGALWFWKPEQALSFHGLKLPNNARDLDLHPDGRRLAVAFFDGAVRVYDMGPKKTG
jgi:WD40 repeat protein